MHYYLLAFVLQEPRGKIYNAHIFCLFDKVVF